MFAVFLAAGVTYTRVWRPVVSRSVRISSDGFRRTNRLGAAPQVDPSCESTVAESIRINLEAYHSIRRHLDRFGGHPSRWKSLQGKTTSGGKITFCCSVPGLSPYPFQGKGGKGGGGDETSQSAACNSLLPVAERGASSQACVWRWRNSAPLLIALIFISTSVTVILLREEIVKYHFSLNVQAEG